MFKKLKSIFIIEEEGTQKATTKATDKQASNPASKNPQPNSQASSGQTTQPAQANYDKASLPKGKPDEKFINRLLGALEQNNIEGFDYLEYKQSLQNLGGVEMDEATKFKSALAMAKTMGATPQKLVSSANHYLKVLKQEENKFLEAFKVQSSKQVTSRNAEIKKLEEGIAQRKAQIEKLQKEIASGEKALQERKGSIDKVKAKVQATKDGFYQAYHIVSSQIAADLEKMKKYLS